MSYQPPSSEATVAQPQTLAVWQLVDGLGRPVLGFTESRSWLNDVPPMTPRIRAKSGPFRWVAYVLTPSTQVV